MPRATGTRLLGGLVRALGRDGSVLCFHGLREDHDEVDSVMNLTLGAFEAAMELVRASAEIVPLEDLHRRWSHGRSTRGLVAVTFDDAYASLLETAHRWYVPAPFPITVFVVTGASARGDSFWWDRLEALADVISQVHWEKIEAACGIPPRLRPLTGRASDRFHAIRQWLLQRERGRAPPALTNALRAVEEELGRCTTQRAMRVDELLRLAELGPVTYGVHTVTHPVLPLLPHAERIAEIGNAWEVLQEWALPSVTPLLAIPFGLSSPSIPGVSLACGMKASLVLDDRLLGRQPWQLASGLISRLSMVERTSPIRLAYRMSGLRDLRTRDLMANQLSRAGHNYAD